MKIINNEKPNWVLFVTLNSGDVFKWQGEYYLKTDVEGQSVRFENGSLDTFPPDCEVYPVNAVLTIS